MPCVEDFPFKSSVHDWFVLKSSTKQEQNKHLLSQAAPVNPRFNAHLELGKLFLSSFLNNIILCIKTKEPNEEKYGRSVWGNDEKYSKLPKNIWKKSLAQAPTTSENFKSRNI